MSYNKYIYKPKVKVNGNFVQAYISMSSVYGLETEINEIKNATKIIYSTSEVVALERVYTDLELLVANKIKPRTLCILPSPDEKFRPEGSRSFGVLEIFKPNSQYAVLRYICTMPSNKIKIWTNIYFNGLKGWVEIEQTTNKVTSLSNASTDEEYPSAKCVYEALQTKQDLIDSTHKLDADLVDDTSSTNKFVTASDKTTWDGKQDALVSGTNIKTINSQSILGSGDISISPGIPTTVKVDGVSITSNDEADILTMNSNYNASTNKLATASDIPTVPTNVSAFTNDAGYLTQHQDISGKQDVIDSSNKLSADYVDDTSTTNKFVTASDKTNWDNKQDASNNSGLNTTDKSIVGAINEVDAVAKGANQAKGFASYSALITELNSASATAYKVGQSFFVQTLEVPDLWILSVESSSSTYTYTTDAAFITATGTSTGQQVGYYKIAQLETQKVDLSNYVPTSRTIAGVDLVDNITKTEMLTALNVTDGAEPNAVASVNGATGTVVLDADDISDTTTTNKFVTSTEKSTWNGKQAGDTKLTSISGLSNSSTGLVKLTNGVASLDNTAYTTNTGTVTSVRVQAGTGLSSSTSTAQTSTLDTTIGIASGYKLPTTTEWGNKQDVIDSSHKLSADLVDDTSSTNKFVTASDKTNWNNKVNDTSIALYNGNAGNPNPVRFMSVDYNECNSENGVFVKVTMVSGHGNGVSYTFLQDATFNVSYIGDVAVDVLKTFGTSITYDSATRQYGDIFWTIDTTNKIVTFYTLMGQYATLRQSPYKRLNSSNKGTITQYTSATLYSSGTKNWANGGDIATMGDIPTSINGMAGGTLTSSLTVASQDEALVLPNNAMIKTSISDGTTTALRTIFGYDANTDRIIVGSPYASLMLRGEGTRPRYNSDSVSLALYSDIPTVKTQTCSTLDDLYSFLETNKNQVLYVKFPDITFTPTKGITAEISSAGTVSVTSNTSSITAYSDGYAYLMNIYTVPGTARNTYYFTVTSEDSAITNYVLYKNASNVINLSLNMSYNYIQTSGSGFNPTYKFQLKQFEGSVNTLPQSTSATVYYLG